MTDAAPGWPDRPEPLPRVAYTREPARDTAYPPHYAMIPTCVVSWDTPAAALPVGSETVRIGARIYSLEAIDGGFIMDKEFGTSYAITKGEGDYRCDCGDARFRRNGLDSRGCKHLVKLREIGLIPGLHLQPAGCC